MKGLLFLAIAAAISTQAFGQDACCAKPAGATDEFAMITRDEAFAKLHEAPLPYSYQGTGTEISFPTADGKPGRGFEIKAAKPSEKYLLVIHEWWGLNDYIKKEAARLAEELPGVNVLAVDLYDGVVAATREEAQKAVGSVVTARAEAILKGAEAHAGTSAKIATIGWCFGGGWSMQAALLGGKNTVGCVIYYGMPEKNVEKLKSLNSDVLGIFAEQDGNINPTVVKQFEADMAAAGKKVMVHEYPAVHAFANPSNPKYDKASAEDAHGKVVAYLKARLGV